MKSDVGGLKMLVLTCVLRNSWSSGVVNALEVIILVMSVFLLFYWFLIATARLFKERSRLSVLHPSTYIYIYIYQTAFKRLTATQTHKDIQWEEHYMYYPKREKLSERWRSN